MILVFSLTFLILQCSAFKQSTSTLIELTSPCFNSNFYSRDSDEQIAQKCSTNVTNGVYHISHNFPKLSVAYKPSVFSYEASVFPEDSFGLWNANQKYRLTICPMWGAAYPLPRLVCNITGDVVTEADGEIDYPLMNCVSVEKNGGDSSWPSIPKQIIKFTSSGPAHLYDAMILAGLVCQVNNQSRILKGTSIVVTFSTDFGFPWGELHAEMWSELLLLIVLVIPKIALALWFWRLCFVFRDCVMQIQWIYVACLVFSIVVSFSYIGYLGEANLTGFKTVFPLAKQTIFMNFLRTTSDLIFGVLILATSKGWGVVRPKLSRVEYQKISGFFVFAFVTFVLQHIFQFSAELVWMTLMVDFSLVLWIFVSLKATRADLSLSSRSDRTTKMIMYAKLARLLCFGMQVWLLSVAVAIIVVVMVFQSNSGMFVGFQIPPTMSWDLAVFVLYVGFGWLWRPSPTTALYSYSFIRQQEEESGGVGEEESDPVASSGMERA